MFASFYCSVVPYYVCSVEFAVDAVLLMAPMILCFTLLSDSAAVLLLSLMVVVITVWTLTAPCPSISHLKQSADLCIVEVAGKHPFVTNYRAFVNAASAVCILAVDFVVFPRRLCKTETYGTGLMDAGVAGYVFANALIAPEARRHINRYLSSKCILVSASVYSFGIFI